MSSMSLVCEGVFMIVLSVPGERVDMVIFSVSVLHAEIKLKSTNMRYIPFI